mmetsp:Transcript_54949/g.112206  ORF Transcript_54949/g.112206 Transcript_54949/m.112206 type:complete len:200 (-) Transcript_54949:134-733(-)
MRRLLGAGQRSFTTASLHGCVSPTSSNHSQTAGYLAFSSCGSNPPLASAGYRADQMLMSARERAEKRRDPRLPAHVPSNLVRNAMVSAFAAAVSGNPKPSSESHFKPDCSRAFSDDSNHSSMNLPSVAWLGPMTAVAPTSAGLSPCFARISRQTALDPNTEEPSGEERRGVPSIGMHKGTFSHTVSSLMDANTAAHFNV